MTPSEIIVSGHNSASRRHPRGTENALMTPHYDFYVFPKKACLTTNPQAVTWITKVRVPVSARSPDMGAERISVAGCRPLTEVKFALSRAPICPNKLAVRIFVGLNAVRGDAAANAGNAAERAARGSMTAHGHALKKGRPQERAPTWKRIDGSDPKTSLGTGILGDRPQTVSPSEKPGKSLPCS